jgi:membrane-associated phospholipid phosphatase
MCAGARASGADEPALAHDESPYHLRLDVDIPVTLLGGVLWAGTTLITDELGPPSCGGTKTQPCDPSALNAFDRLALGHHSTAARTASDALSFVPAVYLALDVADVGIRRWRSYLTDFGIVAEVVAWDGAIQNIVQRAVRRPRPFLYSPSFYPAERDKAESGLSFYSGHTALAFGLATMAGYTFTLRHPHSWLRFLVWPGLLAIASLEPVLRVYSGDHFPTDVIAGAVAGSAIGLLVPALHRRKGNRATAVRLIASTTQQQTIISIVGRF